MTDDKQTPDDKTPDDEKAAAKTPRRGRGKAPSAGPVDVTGKRIFPAGRGETA